MNTVRPLPATTEGPALARQLMRSEFADCARETIDSAELMLSELVTNAVVHGFGPIELELGREADFIRAAVTDTSPRLPTSRTPAEFDPHGRGLHIVQALAHDWGVAEHDTGKSVWFTLRCH